MANPVPARRLRHAAPEARARRLVLSDADYRLFGAIERHGPLPSSLLYEFTKAVRRDRSHLQNRLTEFYNGDAWGSFLTRPPQQFAGYEARYQHLVYDLAPRARHLLAERHTNTLPSTPRSDPFVHRLMCACVGASFELTATDLGLRYISFSEILSRGSNLLARGARNPLTLPSSFAGAPTIIPDLVFGLEYPGEGFRFFAVECDRNTESIKRRNFRQSSFSRKLSAYAAALDAQTYRAWWGVPNLHVLTVTTNAVHANGVLACVSSLVPPQHHARFGIAVAQSFGAHWIVPKSPLSFLLADPWRTTKGTKKVEAP